MVQHALNNPLTALLAEVQLLELEPLPDESRVAAARLVELTRRVVAAARRLDVSGASRPG
jgi:signal transduction histidine kinase